MNIPARSNSSRIKPAHQEKSEEREAWLKLVVKVIRWKEGTSERGSVKLADKITSKEWKAYSKKILSTNITLGKDRIMDNLREIEKMIMSHGGFE